MRDTRRFGGFELELTTAKRRLVVLGLCLDGRLLSCHHRSIAFIRGAPAGFGPC